MDVQHSLGRYRLLKVNLSARGILSSELLAKSFQRPPKQNRPLSLL